MHSSRNERARARAQLQSETPAYSDAELPKLQAQVAGMLRQSGQASPDAAASARFEWPAVARDYFGYVARKKAKAERPARGRSGKD
jgi:hypothetical protein